MMRSLFSGVSGLKSHQTRMDVIGNNIANVNTTGYKSKSITFSDMLYQTTQAATGPNIANGTAGTNPRQIGLGVKTGAINTSITTEGATQSTGNPFDLKITGEAFFVVSDGSNTYFTRDGSFNVDAAGYLCMGSTGYTVMGWTNTDPQTGAIIQETVKPIQIMSEANATYPPAATTAATISGILDKNDDNLLTEIGKQFNIQTYDNLGYEYNLKFGVKPVMSEKTTDRNVTNKETLYELKDLYKVDDSELTFTYTNSLGEEKTLTSTGVPKGLIEELEKAIWEFENTNGTAHEGNSITNKTGGNGHVFGAEDSNVEVDLTSFCKHNNIELGSYSELANATITVNFSGGVAYTTDISANGEPFKLDDEVIEKLYQTNTTNTDASTTYVAYTVNPQAAAGLLVTEKTYVEGTETVTDYVFQSVQDQTNKEKLDLEYSQLTKLMSAFKSELQAQYVTTEPVTTYDTPVPGEYTLSLISMTDSSGAEVDITALGDDGTSFALRYDEFTGKFSYVGAEGNTAFTLNLSAINNKFSNVSFDMSTTTNVDNGNKSTLTGLRDDGRKIGAMTGVSIGTDGVITANYSNGQSKTIAQIAVATFANAMGLANEGDNLYSATANSGEFDGQGVDIKASGTGYMTTGVLEMSNVDLSQEFTDMITTQRGFQANSRIITTSDTLLEELVNLKR